MKKTAMILLGAASALWMSGCADKEQAEEAPVYQYTTEQVYTQMCVKCHGARGEGVADLDKSGKPKGPPINQQEVYELKLSITDFKSGGLNQSSGSDLEVMEHNYKAIKKKGMDYDTDEMAEYIYNNFYVKH